MRFCIGRIRFAVGYETAAVLTVVLLLDTDGRMISCFIAALLHELGHIAVMLRCGMRVWSVSLRLFDVLIRADEPPTFGADVLVTLGGSAANLITAGLCFACCRTLCVASLALGLFNLLPVMTLDGGHMLYICLRRRFSPRACDVVLRAVTFACALPLMTAGCLLLLRSGYNYSLLAIALYLLAVLLLK